MPRIRVRSSVFGSRLALALLVLAICSGAALVGSSALPGSAHAASDQGPIASFSFDAGEGSTVEDLTGNEHTATIEGANWTAAGRFGGAMQFNGAEEDCLRIANSPDLALNEEFTLEAWVRPEGPDYTASVFFKEGEGAAAYAISFGFAEHSRPEGTISPKPSEQVTVEGPGDVPQYTWSHLALTFDGARMRLYVNGAEVDSAETSGPVSSEAPLELGCSKNPKAAFTGRIDEARVYGRALSLAEVQTDDATGLQTPQSGPVAAYSFDEGEGTSLTDLTGNGHTGTVEGADWTKGKYGSALKFKGAEEDCVSIPDAAELRLTEDLTIEAWVKPEGGGHSKAVIFKEDGESFAYGLFAGLEGEGTLVAPGGRTDLEDPTLLEQNAWSHLALTYDGTYLRLYVNGAEVDSAKSAGAVWSGDTLSLGCGKSAGEFFTGRLDEVRIYDRALDAGELVGDEVAPIQTPPSAPIAAYGFDEGTGTTVADLTGNEHTGTIEEGEWAKGRFGSAIEFDGKGKKCVSVADAPDLRLSEEFTLEAWVRAEGGVFGDPVVVKDSEGETAFGIGVGSSEEGLAEGFIGEGKEQSAAIGSEDEVREYAWTHIAATYDGARLRIYVDGELADSQAAPKPPMTGSAAMKIGCDAPNGQFTGRIDEVRVYGRALSEAEIQGDKGAPLQTPQQGPVASYSFDEGKGSTVEDLSGAGHTATIEGAEWITHGRYGGALEFDASREDVVKVADSPDLDFTEEFTLEAWVRPSGAENKWAPLIDKQVAGEGKVGNYLYEGGAVSDRPVGAASKEQEAVNATEALPAHAWSHLALTYDGDRSRLYVNGVLVANQAAKPTISAEGDLEIGGSSETADYFDGRIDEVRIYNRALGPGEMAVNESNGLQTPQRGPVAAYTFDEGQGATAEDLTGNSHNGTIEGPTWTDRGKYGSALSFNGEGEDCVTIPDSEALDLSEELSLEAWVKPSGPTEDDPIIFKEALGTGGMPGYALGIGLASAGKPDAAIGEEGKVRAVVDPNGIESNVWTHLAFTYDGAYMRLYVNGDLVSTETQSTGPLASNGALKIGCSAYWEEGFDGKIDEVRIYDRALRENEAADITRPSFGTNFTSGGFLYEGAATVWFTGATDPGPSGSELFYVYRYSINEGALSAWAISRYPYFSVPTAEVGDTVNFQVYATDAAGNGSQRLGGTVALAKNTTEISEEERKSAEEEAEEEELKLGSTLYESTIMKVPGSSGGPQARTKRAPFGHCYTGAPYPHISTHARLKGHIRINAVGFEECNFPGITGYVETKLERLGPYGPYTVSESPREDLDGTNERIKAVIKEFDCEPGTYYTLTLSLRIPPSEDLEFRDGNYVAKSSFPPQKFTKADCKHG